LAVILNEHNLACLEVRVVTFCNNETELSKLPEHNKPDKGNYTELNNHKRIT